MFYLKTFLFQIYVLFFPFFVLGEALPEKSSEELSNFSPLKEMDFFKKDTPYYRIPVFDGMDLIYSEKFKGIAPVLSDFVEKADLKLSLDFSIKPYFQTNFVIFPSPRRQDSNAIALIYPFPSIFIYPSVSTVFMDRWSMFYWPQDTIIHEMTHLYQFSHNTAFDRFLYKFLGLLSYRNIMLPDFVKEGHAVFNESLYGFGGRLFSSWARAFVFSQIQRGVSLKRLLKVYDDSFANTEKYLHGAYFFAYLHSQYGLKKINHFFLESGRQFPFGFYGLSSALERAFGKNLETLFREYQEYYAPLAIKQKVLSEKALFSSKKSLPINGDGDQLYFLVSDIKSPPKLAVIDKEKEELSLRETDLPLGKVFYINGQYFSVGRGRTSATSIEFSLFGEGFEPLKKYNSQHVMDIYENKVISLDTRQSHTQNSILLNDSFYDNTHSSAIMDHRGRIYYFKQNNNVRTLYRDKEALFSFQSYSAYPVDADEEGLYFIASVPYGSSLFVYREGKGVFRLSKGDRITHARKMKKKTFLVSEIHPSENQYKIIKTEEIPELPFLYTYSFNKQDIFNVQKKDKKQKTDLDLPNPKTGKNLSENDKPIIEKKLIHKNYFYPNKKLTASPLPEARLYKPLIFLKLYQMSLLPYPNLRSLYDFQFPESFQPDHLVSSFYLLSLFQFSDPMYFNTLDLQGFFSSKQKFFKFYYSYKEYRASLSFFFSYEDSPVDKKHFNNFRKLGFLDTTDIYKKKDNSLKDSIPHQDRTIGFAVKYPIVLKSYSDLSVRSQLQFGQKRFPGQTKYKKHPSPFYSSKFLKNYVRQEGAIDYKYKKKYSYAYLPYSQTGLKLAYDMFYVTPNRKNKSILFLNGYVQSHLTRELSKEFFLRWNLVLKRELFSRIGSQSFLQTEKRALFDYSSFHPNFQYLNKMDFQFLKVLNHSYYPLKLPFSVRRWAPLTGLSLLSIRPENEINMGNKTNNKLLLIPYLGVELEFHFLFEKALFKAGISAEKVLNAFPFFVHSPLEWSFWLKGIF